MPERGQSAGASVTGLLSQVDYLAAMRPPARWQTIPKMMADPVISAGLGALKDPILGLTWWVEPPTEDPLDKAVADFLEADLFDMPGRDWPEYISELLRHLELGVMLFERVFEKRDDGLIHLADLAPREPASIVEWLSDAKNGRPSGAVQLVSSGDRVAYDLDELLVFTFGAIGGVWTGTSVLRSSYKPWFIADKLERVEAITAELRGSGITAATLKDPSLKDATEEALMTVRTGEKNFFLEVDGVENFRIVGITGETVPADPIIRRHQLNMMRAVGTEFIAMGGDGGGSRAMHTDKTDTFLLRLNQRADYIGSVHTRKLFPKWISDNFGAQPQGKAWRLKHSKIDTRDLSGLSEALAKLTEAGWLSHQGGDEDWLRTAFDMPEREKTAEPGPTGILSGTVEGVPVEEEGVSVAHAEGRLESEVKLEALGVAFGHVALAERMEKAVDRIVAATEAEREAMTRQLLRQARAAIEAEDAASILGADLGTGNLSTAILSELDGVYDAGVRAAVSEVGEQGARGAKPDPDADKASEALRVARAAVIAGLLADAMRRAWASEVLTQRRTGYNKASLSEILKSLGEKTVLDQARQAVPESMALGRDAVFTSVDPQVDYYIYTTLMERGAGGPPCANCGPLDGAQFSPKDKPSIPNPDCLGGARCRCGLVAVMKRPR